MMMTHFFFWGGTLFSDQFYIIGVIDSHPYPTFSEEHDDSLPSPLGAFVLPIFSLGWSQPACPRIGLREDQQEATIFRGKNHGISCKVSLQPIYRLSKSLHF